MDVLRYVDGVVITLHSYLAMLQSVGYGGGGVQCDVEAIERELGNV